MLHPSRLSNLNQQPIHRDGRFVLYWMQQSQRTVCNHALEYAIAQANDLNLPLVVCFGLMDDYPEANLRHYAFMHQGLNDVEQSLRDRRIKFVINFGQPSRVAIHFATRAAMVVCDRGYLRHQRQWRDEVSRNWTAPQGAGTGIQGFVDVEFDVEQDGHVSSVRIVRSAGVPALDKAAENALRRSALPPLPAEFPAPRATMNVRFHYNEGAGTREETMPLSPALP